MMNNDPLVNQGFDVKIGKVFFFFLSFLFAMVVVVGLLKKKKLIC